MSALGQYLPVSRYCMKVFSPVAGGQVVVFYHPLVEPLRLFHPTVLRCIEESRIKNW